MHTTAYALTEPWRGVELTASAEVEIGGYHDLHNCIDCIGSGFLGPCKPLPTSHSLWTTTISERPWHDEGWGSEFIVKSLVIIKFGSF